jgi:hypothetical protein
VHDLGTQPEVDRHWNDAESERAEECRQKPHAVRDRNDATFAFAQSDRGECLRRAAHLSLKLGIGAGPRLGFGQVDDGDFIGMAARGLIEENAEIDDLKVPLDPLDDRRCMDT